MDEMKAINQNETDTNMCCALPLSYASQAAAQLRLMMDKVEGEDKCTLCKAAEELEKASNNQLSSWNFPWLAMIMLLMCDGFSGGKNIDIEALNAYMDVIKKKFEDPDSKLQNES